MEGGHNFHRATLDGVAVSLQEVEGGKWAVPSSGQLSLGYLFAELAHVSTRHFVLDLGAAEDRPLASTLRLWAATHEGEQWIDAMLDGGPAELEPVEPAAAARERRGRTHSSHQPRLPPNGVLEFDYVVTRPHAGSALVSRPRLDLASPFDRQVAQRLRQLGYAYRWPPPRRSAPQARALDLNPAPEPHPLPPNLPSSLAPPHTPPPVPSPEPLTYPLAPSPSSLAGTTLGSSKCSAATRSRPPSRRPTRPMRRWRRRRR